jgi:lipid-A-disaccharide synthase-like uncharacterized protein
MKESTSRVIVGVEGIFLNVPITGLFLFGGLPGFFYFLRQSPNTKNILEAFACLVITATLVCVWRLLLTFIFFGRAKLKSIPLNWWILPYISAGLSLPGALLPGTAIALFGWGIPLILPLVHLHVERKKSTDN